MTAGELDEEEGAGFDRTPIQSRLDASKPTYISIFGRKGRGKSVLARRYWDTWPGDELCIDVTGDALGPGDVQATYRGDVPDRWPPPLRDDEPVRIRYVPKMESPTWRDDLDRAVGLAFKRPGCLLWIDEVGRVAPLNPGPKVRHLLEQGRHDRLSVVFCGPRPMKIDPLVLAQSDVVYVFKLPNPADRRRIADECGIAPQLLDDQNHKLGDHDYLRWDGNELSSWAPIPLQRARPPRPQRDEN